MNYTKTGTWYKHEEKIRSREVEYIDNWDECKCIDMEFEVFKKPYFFGLIGKKRWICSIVTNSIGIGLSFSKSLI